jgi:hypothetical protein
MAKGWVRQKEHIRLLGSSILTYDLTVVLLGRMVDFLEGGHAGVARGVMAEFKSRPAVSYRHVNLALAVPPAGIENPKVIIAALRRLETGTVEIRLFENAIPMVSSIEKPPLRRSPRISQRPE